MSEVTVRVHTGQAKYFRKLAREEAERSGKEIQAYLSGRVVSPQLVVVDKFHYPNEYYTQLPGEVSWLLSEYQDLQKEVEADGKRIIGDAHSHPNWDSVMSPYDYRSHIAEGFRVAGICSVKDGRTRLRFWVAESALPATIEYVP